MRRLILLIVVVLGLAPGAWLRTPGPLPVGTARELWITRLSAPPRELHGLGELRFLAAWHLRSPNAHFGGYSALVSLGGGRLLAASDRGRVLAISGLQTRQPEAAFGYFGGREPDAKAYADIESMTRDPRSGRLWLGYEASNRIERWDAGFLRPRDVAPELMRHWRANSGAEGLVRLADGRFIVLAERGREWSGPTSPGLLFPADPIKGAQPVSFRFVRPSGYSPTDMAQLPDGRVMILLRALDWPLPLRFSAKLAVADPAEIEDGGTWTARVVADLASPLPTDNFEGLTIEPLAGGGAILWLISDDNQAPAQRTLLLKLYWAGRQAAHEKGARIARAPFD